MNSNSEIQEPEIMEPEDQVEEIDGDSSPSVDEFLMELEAKEKDLHITADYQIEIADSDIDEANIPEFVQQESAVTGNSGESIAGAQPSGLKTRVFELEKEIESLNNKLAALRMERNDVQQKSDRRLKDFESYKYRMDRERRGSVISQIGNLATQLLPVLDNLDRALDSVKDVSEKKRDEFKQFFDGIALVNQQINEVLSGMGVRPIATVSETFDPNFHEAVATEENLELPPNTISAEMLRGYRIGNLVIRHSMVKVTTPPMHSKGKAKERKEVQESPTPDPTPQPPNTLPDEPPVDGEEASS